MTGIYGKLTGRPLNPNIGSVPTSRVKRMISQINALRRQDYTLGEISAFYEVDIRTVSMRTYGIADDNGVTESKPENMMYRRMHIGACCHLDYEFIGIGDNTAEDPGNLKFGTKIEKRLHELNVSYEREKRKIITG